MKQQLKIKEFDENDITPKSNLKIKKIKSFKR